MEKELMSCFFPKEILGKTKDVTCISCGAPQRMFYPCYKSSNVYGLFMECRVCKHWFQVNIEAGEQVPIDCTTGETEE